MPPQKAERRYDSTVGNKRRGGAKVSLAWIPGLKRRRSCRSCLGSSVWRTLDKVTGGDVMIYLGALISPAIGKRRNGEVEAQKMRDGRVWLSCGGT
jgi:hypothetical protein